MADTVPLEEIRFAVVLNGGVSLAVWMGGAVLEIDRLTRGDGPYGGLLELVGGTARVDVISGTSAGGINGAALALSQVNEQADLRQLRDLWAEQGDIDALMRRPFRGSPVSLLRGDGYFLPQLEAAFWRLVSPYRKRSPDERPVDLTITTTLLHGAKTEHVDALGQKLPQSLHNGRFRFRHDSEQSAPAGQAVSTDFEPDQIKQTVARLALAARSTASFPLAFEPAYVPVDADAPVRGLPDMAAVASWADPGSTNRSRFAVDGGLLANTPTREALEAIDRMPADGPVHRVMLVVYPHAMATVADDPDRPDEMPTVLDTTALLVGAVSSQGSRTFVEEIDQHNRRAASRQIGRSDLLDSFRGDAASLYQIADQLGPLYKRVRLHRMARDASAQVPAAANWPYERIRGCAERVQNERLDDLPYLSRQPPKAAAVEIATEGSGWHWGVATAEHLAESALDLVSRLSRVVAGAAGEEMSGTRAALFQARLEIRRQRNEVDLPWATGDSEPNEAYWRRRLDWYRDRMLPPGAVGETIRRQVMTIAELVAGTVGPLRHLGGRQIELAGLAPWRDLIIEERADGEDERDAVRVLSRLLALEILTTCLAEETESGLSLPVELVQMSLMTQSPFAKRTTTPHDKGAGMALARFAGFLKQSWRVNDWIWGRLDASATLCRILLNPELLRRKAVLDGRLGQIPAAEIARNTVDAVVRTFGIEGSAGTLPAELERLREQAIAELEPVYEPCLPTDGLPAASHALADLAIWSVQIRIAAEELPALAAAALADRLDGCNPNARGVQFADANRRLLDSLGPTMPGDQRIELGMQALDAFDRAGIGHEALCDEAASDRLIRTTIEAASVAVTVLDSPRSGLPAVKPITRLLRGAALLPYWAIRGVTGGGTIAKFLALLGFSVGGMLLAVALLGDLPGWATAPAAAAGAGMLLCAFAYGALRTGTVLHSIVLLAPAVPLVVYGFTKVNAAGVKGEHGSWMVVVMALIVILLIVLGSLPAFPPSPLTVVRALGPLLLGRHRGASATAGIALLVGGLTVSTVRPAGPRVAAWYGATVGPHQTIYAVVVAAVLLAVMSTVAWRLSGGLRTWTETGEDGFELGASTDPAASAAGWSVVYAVLFTIAAYALHHWKVAKGETWMAASFFTATGFAAALLLIVPWFVPWRARCRISRRVLEEATRDLYPVRSPAGTPEQLVRRLRFTGCTYRYLLTVEAGRPGLTAAGRRLARLIDRKLCGAAPDGGRPKPAGRRRPRAAGGGLGPRADHAVAAGPLGGVEPLVRERHDLGGERPLGARGDADAHRDGELGRQAGPVEGLDRRADALGDGRRGVSRQVP